MGTAIVVALFAGIAVMAGVGIALRTRARSFFEREGFKRLPECPVTLPLPGHVSVLDCFSGELWPGRSAILFLATSHPPSAGWSTPVHAVGVYLAPEARLPDGWLDAWAQRVKPHAETTDAPALAERDDKGGSVVLWHVLDSEKNAKDVLGALRASPPAARTA